MERYSAFSLLKHALSHHENWQRAWRNPEPKKHYDVIVVGGGGHGLATAYYLAKKGKRVLVFSVDPQASLSDIFERDIFGQGNIEIMPNLFAREVDADRRIQDYQEEIRQKILSMYGMKKIPEEIESYIKASSAEPAMEESAIFDAVVDIEVPSQVIGDHGVVVEASHPSSSLGMAVVYFEYSMRMTS